MTALAFPASPSPPPDAHALDDALAGLDEPTQERIKAAFGDALTWLHAELDEARESLQRELIALIPMAKAYALANPVGRNVEKVQEAEALLRRTLAASDKGDEQ